VVENKKDSRRFIRSLRIVAEPVEIDEVTWMRDRVSES
jgi:hypothetical protein